MLVFGKKRACLPKRKSDGSSELAVVLTGMGKFKSDTFYVIVVIIAD